MNSAIAGFVRRPIILGPLLAAIVIAGAAARGSAVDASLAPADPGGDEWRNLAIQPLSQGSETGGPALPGTAVELAEADAAPAFGPVRLTGKAGANLNRAMADAGVPARIAEEYLRALAAHIPLASGISVEDRFDLVIDRTPDGERLVYAGLDRLGASDVQLMRWSVDGRAGWVDASGTAVQAEVMRMPVSGGVSSSFGMRYHPILRYQRFHRGVDLKATFGTPIRAPADGRILFAGWSGGYGRQVRVGHGDGLATSFSHMSRIAAAPGQWVRSGEVIGYVGSSGLSTGPHLHYEVTKAGRAVNPLSVRYAGGGNPMDRQERHDFNATLRALLSSNRSS